MKTTKKSKKLLNTNLPKIEFIEDGHKYFVDGVDHTGKSVTKYTGIINKADALVPWAVKLAIEEIKKSIRLPLHVELNAKNAWRNNRDNAGKLGTEVHSLIEKFIKDWIRNGEMPDWKMYVESNNEGISCYYINEHQIDKRIYNGLSAFINWAKEIDLLPLHSELRFYSRKHDFLGTIDCIGYVYGKLCLIDFKTCNGIYADHVLQVGGGYWILWNELQNYLKNPLTVESLWLLQLGKDDGLFKPHSVNIPFDILGEGFLAAQKLTLTVEKIKNVLEGKTEKKVMRI